MPVVERHVGRRPQHDEHACRVDGELLEQRAVGLEVGEVVLLLQPRVLQQLRRNGAVLLQPLRRDRVGHDDLRRRAAAELMLDRRVLVVERRRRRNAEPPRRDRQLVRPVRERDVEIAALRPLAQRAEPVRHQSRLLHARPAAVLADHRCLEAVQLEQLQRLRVVACRDLDVVAAPAHDLDQRPEDERVRARGHVDPDPHATRSTRRKRSATIIVSGSSGRLKNVSCATRQSSTVSKPSPSSRANCSSISEAGHDACLGHLDDARSARCRSLRAGTGRRADGTASPSSSYSSSSPAVAVFAPASTASTSCRRSSVRG